MTGEGEIIEALGRLINGKITAAFTGKVTSIEEAETKGIVVVTHNELTYDVKLKSITDESDKHLLPIPKEGSMIFCVSEGNSEERFIALAFNELDKIIYNGENMNLLIDDINKKFEVFIGATSMAMSESGIIFNEAAKSSFMTDINKLVEKVNTIEQDINALKDVFKNWVPTPQDGGGALKGGVATWAGQAITETTVNDLKDETIQH